MMCPPMSENSARRIARRASVTLEFAELTGSFPDNRRQALFREIAEIRRTVSSA